MQDATGYAARAGARTDSEVRRWAGSRVFRPRALHGAAGVPTGARSTAKSAHPATALRHGFYHLPTTLTRHEIAYADDESAGTGTRTRTGAAQPGASAAAARPPPRGGDDNRHVPRADSGNISDHHWLRARLR